MSELAFIGPTLLIALAFSMSRAIADLRAKRYVWAIAGAVCALAIGAALVMPIQTHAVKVDLPQ